MPFSVEVPEYALLAVGGIVVGLGLLVRGFVSYGTATRIADMSVSRITSVAVGEAAISGVVEPAEVTLVSPLQSERCVYYRAEIDESRGDNEAKVLDDERAVGFRVRDPSGDVRIFPRAARFDVPFRFDERTDAFGDQPAGLRLRRGPGYAAAESTREQQIADLLTVRPAAPADDWGPDEVGGGVLRVGFGSASGRRTRRYREARIEPGDVVTVIGRVVPFDQLPDPDAADHLDSPLGPTASLRDPEIAADIAAARAAGVLAETPEAAWGNAAIPGFGIGRPVRPAELDPRAIGTPLATADEAARASRTFDIEPHALVFAVGPDVPLVIAIGAPAAASARHERQFLIGLLGAVLAIGRFRRRRGR